MHILDDLGDLSEGWFLHTHIWMHVSEIMVGIIGENLRTRGVLAFMSTGALNKKIYCFFKDKHCVKKKKITRKQS